MGTAGRRRARRQAGGPPDIFPCEGAHPNAHLRPPAASAFTLVEVALALLVVAVGLMGAFALFPSGLDAGRTAQNETRAAMFADETFNSFRALAEAYPWNTFDQQVPPYLGTETWYDYPGELAPRVTGNSIRVNRYESGLAARKFADSSWRPDERVSEYALRYKFDIRVLGSPTRKSMRLVVWPGEFGSSNEKDAFVFYTEIYDWGL